MTLILSLILVGCVENEEGGFISLSKGNLFGAGEEGFEKENIIISNSDEWNSFLSKIDTTNKVSDTFDNSIDFSKESVCIAMDKVRNSGGFSIEILEVVNEGETTIIKIESIGPKPGDMSTMAMIQPYHIIKINKTKKKIKFLEL